MDGWMFSYMDGWVFSYIQTWNTQIATLYFVINVVVAVKMVLHWNHFHHSQQVMIQDKDLPPSLVEDLYGVQVHL